MNLTNRSCLTQERNQYKMQKAQSTIATLNAQMHTANSYASIPSNYPPGTIPLNNTHASIQQTYTIPPYPSQIQVIPPPPPLPEQTGTSQVSELSRGSGTFMGGRNERAMQSQRHNQGGYGSH